MSKTPIELAIDSVVAPNEKPKGIKDDQLWATHSGVLKIGDIELRCHILSNGLRIFDAVDIDNIFGDFKDLLGKNIKSE